MKRLIRAQQISPIEDDQSDNPKPSALGFELDPEQEDFLYNYGVHIEGLKKLPGSQLHEYMIRTDGYTDGSFLVFFDDHNGGSMRDQKKFLYYMGAENEAELEAKHFGITIWGNIDEDRLKGSI